MGIKPVVHFGVPLDHSFKAMAHLSLFWFTYILSGVLQQEHIDHGFKQTQYQKWAQRVYMTTNYIAEQQTIIPGLDVNQHITIIVSASLLQSIFNSKLHSSASGLSIFILQ